MLQLSVLLKWGCPSYKDINIKSKQGCCAICSGWKDWVVKTLLSSLQLNQLNNLLQVLLSPAVLYVFCKDIYFWFTAHPDNSGRSHFKILNLNTSVKTLYPRSHLEALEIRTWAYLLGVTTQPTTYIHHQAHMQAGPTAHISELGCCTGVISLTVVVRKAYFTNIILKEI